LGIHERKEREKEHRREEIIDAAQQVFFEKGLFMATMDDIAEKAELSKGTLYLYYKSKEDLYLAVTMRGMQLLLELFQSVLDSVSSVPKALDRLADSYLDYFNRHRDYFRMLHFFQTPQFHKQVSDEMKQSCDLLNQRIWDVVRELLRRGIQDKSPRTDPNPFEGVFITWASATALMRNIDNNLELWNERFQLDLFHTLKVSNRVLLDAILTDKGKNELAADQNT
jgi:TetR/AcrR family transcriptional regulator